MQITQSVCSTLKSVFFVEDFDLELSTFCVILQLFLIFIGAREGGVAASMEIRQKNGNWLNRKT
jgi:hypothetical protein